VRRLFKTPHQDGSWFRAELDSSQNQTNKNERTIMKIRDISLLATGAIISVALIALTFTLFNPPKAQAQAASGAGTPGAGAMIVTVAPFSTNTPPNSGVITINDSSTKKVTVVTYSGSTVNPPTIRLSSPASFTYQ
jgi:hypothetical protein